MNHFYRLVWNVSKHIWVPASELASSRKKNNVSPKKRMLVGLLASTVPIGGILAKEPVATTVIPSGGNTSAYISANGVPVVNINTANAAGLSHNNYTRFDVEANGLVLNNGNRSQLLRQSELAGQVAANMNLRNEATIILNEVSSPNRSTLAGFTEVLGGKADVILANPYGITCNGCGFINTDRATLTTGTANVGVNGNLIDFSVRQGDILIEGAGVNATRQQIFDLVARSVKFDANINVNQTGSLGITTGVNDWDYLTREANVSSGGEGDIPEYAIDSSVLGGMYAGRIRLIATEAGVGVNMLGDAAASADDFILTSAGKIEIQSSVSAEQDLSLSTASNLGSNDLFLNDAILSANRDLSLLAEDGEINLSEGELYAANNLTLTSSTLTDLATASNTRFGGGNTSFTANYTAFPCQGEDCRFITTAFIDGSIWGAGAAFSASAENLDIGDSGATLYAGSTLNLTSARNLNLNTAAIAAVGDMTLVADSSIRTEAAESQGISSTMGNLNITTSSFSNFGEISADSGSITSIGNWFGNAGVLYAKTDLNLSDDNNGSSLRIENLGTIISEGTFEVVGRDLTNRSEGNIRIASATDLNLYSFDNQGTFILFEEVASSQSSNFILTRFANSGTLQTSGNLAIDASYDFENSGNLLTGNNLDISADDSELAISNTSTGLLQAGGALTLSGMNAAFAIQEGTVLGNTVDMTLNSLANTGRLQSTMDMDLVLGISSNTLNSGIVHAGQNLSWETAGALYNGAGAGISSLDTLSFNNNRLYNSGSLYAGNNINVDLVNSLSNYLGAEINSSGDINFDGDQFYNEGKINALNDINISTRSYFSNSISGGTPSTSRYLISSITSTINEGPEVEQCSAGPCTEPSKLWVYEDTLTYGESLTRALPEKPVLIAGNDMTINMGAGNGRNFLGLMSATNTLNLNGTGNFTNEAFSLNYSYEKRRYLKWLYDPGFLNGPDQWRYAYAEDHQFDDPLPNMAGTNNYLSYGITGEWFFLAAYNPSTSDSSSYLQAHRNDADLVYSDGPAIETFSSNIKAGSINGTLGNLNNLGITQDPGVGSVTNTSSTVGITELSDGSGISFNGVVINLPTNPNGFFVESQSANANYLVETNPLYTVGTNFVGSDYLIENYGYDPEVKLRRVGDANYEAYLIRQQLIAQTGVNILMGYDSEADQMQKLMDQATQQSLFFGDGKHAFVFGQPLTNDQVKYLQQDMIWMVETTVKGEKVLAPVIYLAASTRQAINTGAAITGKNINLDVASLTNTGGSITGSETLSVLSEGDITNTSGSIRGGNVDLTSTQGSIINQTEVIGQGDSISYTTNIGKTAVIESTNALTLSAEKDIKVIGASVTAGGNAAISAEGDILVDTIVDKTIRTTGTSKETTHGYSTSLTTVETETNIGSGIKIGGDAVIQAGDQATIRGSEIDVKGKALIEGKNGLNVLDAVDKKRTTVVTETSELFGSDSASESGSDSASESGSASGFGFANAKALAEAQAESEGTADFKLGESTRTVKTSGSNTSVGSKIKTGGDLTLSSEAGLIVQGSDVEAGSNLNINAKSVDVLAGQNSEWSEETITRNSIGIYVEGEAEAKAEAGAGARAGTSAGLGGDSQAGAEAEASAGGAVTMGARKETEHNTYSKTTNTGSSLKAGNNLNITATEDARFVGANIESGDDMVINAKNIINQAAQDREHSTTSKATETVGLYLDASVGAESNASSKVDTSLHPVTALGGNHASASAGVSAEAEVGAGLRYNTTSESGSETTITNTGNTFKSGGNFSRTATETIVDQATEVEAGGNIDQTAKVIRDEAVHDSYTKTEESEEHDARVGVYAGGSAEASGEADAALKGRNNHGTGKDAEAGAGVSAQYEMDESSGFEENKTAVISKFKSGGNITSKSEEATTLVGTKFESAGDTTIEAGSLDYQAAQDSTTTRESTNKIAAEAKLALYGSEGGKAEAEYEHGTKNTDSSTAKAGSINAGGNLTIKTKEDTKLVGTALSAGNQASIEAGGDVDFQAAKSTASSTEGTLGASASVSATKSNKGMEAELEGGYANEKSETAVVGGIKSGSGGTSIISKTGSVKLEGTQLDSNGVTSIDAKQSVELKAAESTSTGIELEGSVQGMHHKEGPGLYKGGDAEGGGGLSGNYSDKVESTTTQINSAGGVQINATRIDNQEAKLSSKNGEVVKTGQEIHTKANQTNISVGDDVQGKSEASTAEDVKE